METMGTSSTDTQQQLDSNEDSNEDSNVVPQCTTFDQPPQKLTTTPFMSYSMNGHPEPELHVY